MEIEITLSATGQTIHLRTSVWKMKYNQTSSWYDQPWPMDLWRTHEWLHGPKPLWLDDLEHFLLLITKGHCITIQPFDRHAQTYVIVEAPLGLAHLNQLLNAVAAMWASIYADQTADPGPGGCCSGCSQLWDISLAASREAFKRNAKLLWPTKTMWSCVTDFNCPGGHGQKNWHLVMPWCEMFSAECLPAA